MAQEPKSRPEPPAPPQRKFNPQTPDSVYGGRWGQGDSDAPPGVGAPDRPEPIDPHKKEK
jgi:hypothetical protein